MSIVFLHFSIKIRSKQKTHPLKDSFWHFIEYVPRRRKEKRRFLTFFALLCDYQTETFSSFSSAIFSALFFWIKFRKTKQIVVALVATTFKTLLSVAKTNGRLSGRKFYAGNIDNLFRNMLAHIFFYQHKKVRQPKSAHRKTSTPIVAKQSLHSIGSLYNQAGAALLPKWVCSIV